MSSMLLSMQTLTLHVLRYRLRAAGRVTHRAGAAVQPRATKPPLLTETPRCRSHQKPLLKNWRRSGSPSDWGYTIIAPSRLGLPPASLSHSAVASAAWGLGFTIEGGLWVRGFGIGYGCGA